MRFRQSLYVDYENSKTTGTIYTALSNKHLADDDTIQQPTRRQQRSTKIADDRRPPSCYSQTVTSLPVRGTSGLRHRHDGVGLPT